MPVTMLPNLLKDCRNLMSENFIFEQHAAPAHTATVAQDWIRKKCPGFTGKDEWPPNSPELNPLDYHVWGAMLGRYQKHIPKPTNIAMVTEDCPAVDMERFATFAYKYFLESHYMQLLTMRRFDMVL